MKRLLLVFLLSGVVFAHSAGIPTSTAIINAVYTGIASTYGTSAASPGGNALSGLKGVSRVAIYNGAASAIAVNVRTTAADCSSASGDHFYVPATTGLVVEDVAVGKLVCLRSLSGGSLNTGTVAVSAW